jgi:hypothetical protein
MKDNSPLPEIDDEQLLAYLDGQADPEVVTQIERTEIYLKRAQALARVQNRLVAQLYRLECPETIELGEYHLGMLSREQTRAIEQHLRVCPHCSREIAELREQLAEEQPGENSTLLARIDVLVARLVSSAAGASGFEHAGKVPALGVRGKNEETYIYEADGFQVVIDIQEDGEHPGHKVLLGLITGTAANQFEIDLIRDGEIVANSHVDDLGNFIIPGISPGEYQLNIHGSKVEIQILTLQV